MTNLPIYHDAFDVYVEFKLFPYITMLLMNVYVEFKLFPYITMLLMNVYVEVTLLSVREYPFQMLFLSHVPLFFPYSWVHQRLIQNMENLANTGWCRQLFLLKI